MPAEAQERLIGSEKGRIHPQITQMNADETVHLRLSANGAFV